LTYTTNASLPTASNNARLITSVNSNSGSTPTVGNVLLLSSVNINISIIVNGTANFDSFSSNTGNLTGNCIFSNSSNNFGTITGKVSFYTASSNYYGTINGDAYFYNNSNNEDGSITPTTRAIFNNTSTNNGYIYGDAEFNDTAANYNYVSGTIYCNSPNC